MKPYNKILSSFLFIALMGLLACGQDDGVTNIPQTGGNDVDTTAEATTLDRSNLILPANNILDGGPGVDGIPALLNPDALPISEVSNLTDEELIVGVRVGNVARAYPHQILDWHEIVNDNLNSEAISVTYCPLTGSAIGWDTEVDGQTTTFGVSGLLFNSNLMPYDRRTGSVWSQMLLQNISGPNAGNAVNTFQIVETTWATWKQMYPESDVISENTGFNRNYGFYPYGNFREVERPLFPVSRTDARLFAKERVLGILSDGEVKAYRFASFTEDRIVRDQINGQQVVVIGSQEKNFLVAFSNGDDKQFSLPEGESAEIVAVDALGNRYDIFGEVISGPDQGTKLERVESFIAFWYSFPAFYEEVAIFEE